MAGYLYAIHAGHWLSPDTGEYRLHVKMGSTRSKYPAQSLRKRYETSFGDAQILWMHASFRAYADEHDQLFTFFAPQRVWVRREIFTFKDLDEFKDLVGTFETHYRTSGHLAIPESSDPPPVTVAFKAALEKQRVKQAQMRLEAEQLKQLERQETKRRVERREEVGRKWRSLYRGVMKLVAGREWIEEVKEWIDTHVVEGGEHDFVTLTEILKGLKDAGVTSIDSTIKLKPRIQSIWPQRPILAKLWVKNQRYYQAIVGIKLEDSGMDTD